MIYRILSLLLLLPLIRCSEPKAEENKSQGKIHQDTEIIKPKYVTGKLPNDSDDPAIWYNKDNPSKSLILGTDKMESKGGVYVFDIQGNLDTTLMAYPLDRPNNVDIAYGLQYKDSIVDIAVVAERISGSIRIFSMPDLQALDNGGIKVFQDDTANEVMGIALYTRPEDGEIFAIVSRKENPEDNDDYLYQYRLYEEGGTVKGDLVRKFGKFSGTAEIEAIAVDNELGYVYYSDEMYGIRKYYADPDHGDEELAVFGLEGFTDDREGITIFKADSLHGYILVSDQGANKFRVYPREGTQEDANIHPEIAVLNMSTLSSDGSEVLAKPLGAEFPQGIFVAMSDNKTFEIYDWRDLQEIINKNLSQTERQ